MNTRSAYVIGPRETMGAWLRDLWTYRNVLAALCARDIKGKYKQAALGVSWAVVQPLIQVLLFTLVFRGVVKIDSPVAYPLFVLAALLPFNLFQQVITTGTPAFVGAQGIITKVYFPRVYTVIAGSSSALMNGAINAVLLIIALVVYAQGVSVRMLFVLPMLAGVLLLALGIAFILGALNAKFRDVQHALPLLMTALIYVSPVLYPLDRVPERLRPLMFLNPITGLVDGFRSSLLGLPPYSWPLVWGALAFSVLIFVVGVLLFERTQAELIDVL